MKKLFKKQLVFVIMVCVLLTGVASTSFAATAAKLKVKTVTASQFGTDGSGPHLPKHTLDGILNKQASENMWAASGKGQWIKYQFSKSYTLTKLRVQWHAGKTQSTTFEVHTSTDNKKWTKVWGRGISHKKTGTEVDNDWKEYTLKSSKGVYLRITGFGNDSKAWPSWNSICEVEIFGY
jgi:poly(beta-D-mannuronate) lyase